MEQLLQELLARVESIQAEQQQMAQLLKLGVTPPEWVTAEALEKALGLKRRGAEYYRYNLGVIPVDGVVCRRAGRGYEYRLAECRRLVEDYRALPAESRRALKEAWQQSREVGHSSPSTMSR